MQKQFDEDRLNQAVKRYRERIDIDKLLAVRLQHCMELAKKLCDQIAESIGKDLIRCKESDGIITLVTRDRVLSFAPAGGVASDARLRRPLGLACRQVLVFGHLEGQESSTLLSAFRVYADGHCSDGDVTWKLDAVNPDKFGNYLLEVIASNLLDFEVFWPPTDEFPDFIRKITIQENKPEPAQLKNVCVGFECDIEASATKSDSDTSN